MQQKNTALCLMLVASLVAGCGEDPAPSTTGTSTTTVNTMTTTVNTMTPTTNATPDGGGVVACVTTGAPVLYRVNTITIPTREDVQMGEPAGHNVDGVDTVCEQPDGPGGVDNGIVSLLGGVATVAPALNIQSLVDTALACTPDSTDCVDLELILSVTTGPGCVTGRLEDAQGNAISGEYSGTLDAAGAFRATTDQLEISIPFPVEGSPEPFRIDLDIRNLILTGNLSAAGITNIVIGGVLPGEGLEATLEPIIGEIPGLPEWEFIVPIVRGNYDVEVAPGNCGSLSIGLLATALPYTPDL